MAARRKPGGGSTRDSPSLDLGILPGLLGYNLRRAQVEVWRDFLRNVGSGDLRPALFSVLVLAEANPGLAQIQLARQLAIDKASVVAVIDKLESDGLIARRRSTVDRRRQGLHITPAGIRRLKSLKREIAVHEKRFLDRLAPGETDLLLALLKRIYE